MEDGTVVNRLISCLFTHTSGGQELSTEELGDIRRRQEREQQLAAKYPGIRRNVHTLCVLHVDVYVCVTNGRVRVALAE